MTLMYAMHHLDTKVDAPVPLELTVEVRVQKESGVFREGLRASYCKLMMMGEKVQVTGCGYCRGYCKRGGLRATAAKCYA